MEEGTPLLKIIIGGELVAEATLHIYNGPVAWQGFQDGFQYLAGEVVGELFNTMRIACNPSLRLKHGPQGITIDLQMPGGE
jgi:hypothetical protein